MAKLSEKGTPTYLTLVKRLARTSTNYKALDEFLSANGHVSQSPAKYTVVTFPSEHSISPGIQCDEFEDAEVLAQRLDQPDATNSCRLFLVENICAETIITLGQKFDIDPQFFADHLNNEPWYRIDNIADRIPALPSSQKLHEYLQLRFIEPRELSSYPDLFHGSEPFAVQKENTGLKDEDVVASDAQSFMMPDGMSTRIPRKAGKLTPRVRKGRKFEPLLCTRQVVTVWFKRYEGGSNAWTGIILLDPPFQLPPGNIYCEPPGHRSFNRRASLLDEVNNTPPPGSNREALARHLIERFTHNHTLLEGVKSDCFLVLGDVYRLIASNWIVINEYVNRELATVEHILEKEEPAFRDLEVYLKDLYIYRRRATKYHDFITQAKEQCTTRGQPSWSSGTASQLSLDHARDMEADFIYLQDKVLATSQRIEKNINLLTALVAIGEGKQALDENHALARLSLLATVFLPFSTVATIFSIQGTYGPGASRFWLFWAIAIPLTGFVLGLSALYYGIGGSIMRKVVDVLDFRNRSARSRS